MIRWLRRMLKLSVPDRRAVPRIIPATPAPAPPPLVSTRAELARTAPLHRRRIAKADRILDDYQAFDGALRLVAVRRRR